MAALNPKKSYQNFRWHFAMKQKGLTNQFIADVCSVALCTINRWSKRLEIPKYLKMDRNSDAYRAWRNRVFNRDNFRCVKCGNRGNIQAHHPKPWATHPKERLALSNGITLCEYCHSRIHPWMRQLYEAKSR